MISIHPKTNSSLRSTFFLFLISLFFYSCDGCGPTCKDNVSCCPDGTECCKEIPPCIAPDTVSSSNWFLQRLTSNPQNDPCKFLERRFYFPSSSFEAQVKPALLTSNDTLEIKWSPYRKITFVKTYTSTNLNYSSWGYKVVENGSSHGNALLSFIGSDPGSGKGNLVGDFEVDGRTYELRKCRGDRYFIGHLDFGQVEKIIYDNPEGLPVPPSKCLTESGNGVIDMVVLYTDTVWKIWGDSIQYIIIEHLEKTNFAFSNSGLDPRLHLAYMGPAPNPPSILTLNTNLGAKIRSPETISYMEAQKAIHNADLALIIVQADTGIYKGYAKDGSILMQHNWHPREFGLAHEVGHCLGLDHDDYCSQGKRQTIMVEKTDSIRVSRYALDRCDNTIHIDTTIQENAEELSGYHCRNILFKVMIPDDFEDNGSNQSDRTGRSPLYSPFLYIRKTQDLLRQHLFQAEAMSPNQENYAYTILHNGSTEHQKGVIKVYGCDSSDVANLSRKVGEMELLAQSDSILLPPLQEVLVELVLPSSFASTQAPVLMTRWVSSSDTTKIDTSQFLAEYIHQDHQAAGRASTVLPLTNDQPGVRAPSFSSAPDSLSTTVEFKFFPMLGDQIRISTIPRHPNPLTFMEAGGKIELTYKGKNVLGFAKTHPSILDPNQSGANVRYFDRWPNFNVVGTAVKIGQVTFSIPANSPPGIYPVHVELLSSGELKGSYTYELQVNGN